MDEYHWYLHHCHEIVPPPPLLLRQWPQHEQLVQLNCQLLSHKHRRRLQLLVVKRSVQLEWTDQSATSYDVQLTPWVRLRNDLPFFVSIRIEVQ